MHNKHAVFYHTNPIGRYALNKNRHTMYELNYVKLFQAGKFSLLYLFYNFLFFQKTLYNREIKCYNAVCVGFYKVLINPC